jgi:hypothetical protein
MDAKLFRLPTKPNFYAAVQAANPFSLDQQAKRSEFPGVDSRFPGYAAQMSDGRLVTDYMNHCSKNVPTGQQFATKAWMTKNASHLIQISRDRFAERTGAIYSVDRTTVPPPAVVVKCEANTCYRIPRNDPGAIGTERADSAAPDLFGTWEPTIVPAPPVPKTPLTAVYEGGRNTPRGAPLR